MTGQATTAREALALARLLADEADKVSLGLYRHRHELAWQAKPDLTEVSQADRTIEDRLRQLLRVHDPDRGVLGEEQGPSGDQRARWLLDPIDATKNFLWGLDFWATLLALEIDGQIDVAMISAPAMGRRWWATRGGGAYTTHPLHAIPQPLLVSQADDLEDAHLAYGDLRRDPWFLDLASRCWRTRGIGDFLMFCLVAEGAMDIAVGQDGDQLWDLAAPKLLVEEAGGRFTDLAGRPRADGGVGLASNGLLHQAVLDAIPPSAVLPAPVGDRGG